MLATQVTAARADAPPPPAIPTIAVQVSVSVPGVSVDVQAGTVNVSVSTESVEVSVAVSTEGAAPSTGASATGEQQQAIPTGEQQQPTQIAGASSGQAEQVVPAETSANKRRPPRAPRPARLARPPIRAATTTAGRRPIRSARVDRSTRVPGAKEVPERASEPRTTGPKAPRRCCKTARAATPIAAAPIRLGARPKLDSWRERYELAGVAPARLSEEVVRDNRLLLQLGVLAAFLYLVCLAGWFSGTKLRRTRA